MNQKTKKLIILITLSISITVFSSCTKKQTEETETPLKGVEVSAASPVKQKMTEYLDLNASTFFLSQEIIRATFSGFITKTHKNLGDYVKKGDLLFSIRTKESAAMDSSNLRNQFNGLVNIYAHSDGVLTELSSHSGDYITESDRLALIIDPSSLRIMLNAPFRYAGKVLMSARYSIKLPDNKEMTAEVVKKIPSIDPVNQTQSFILKPVTDVKLPANLNLIVKIPLQGITEAIALPKNAIVTNETQSEFWVMKILNDSTAVRLNITKGIENDSLVQVKEPVLSGSDRFITEGAYGLPDTVNISIKK
jgi:multidrug efflux pump subunit AcrA (membrane-fusion protein)